MACGDKSDDTAGSEDSTGDTTEETSGSRFGQWSSGSWWTLYGLSCQQSRYGNQVTELTDEELEAVIQTGSGSMPGQGLNATDLRDVIAYIRATYGW